MPDPTIFTITTEFKFDRLANRLRELAFLNPGPGNQRFMDERAEPPKKESISLQAWHRGVREAARRKQAGLHPKPVVMASRQRQG